MTNQSYGIQELAFTNIITKRFRDWLTPRSKDRDTAFRERTIRLVVGLGVFLITLTLLTSLFIFRDPWELVSYPTLFALMLIVGVASGAMVNRQRVLVAGWLLTFDWMLAAVGVVVMGQGYAATQ